MYKFIDHGAAHRPANAHLPPGNIQSRHLDDPDPSLSIIVDKVVIRGEIIESRLIVESGRNRNALSHHWVAQGKNYILEVSKSKFCQSRVYILEQSTKNVTRARRRRSKRNQEAERQHGYWVKRLNSNQVTGSVASQKKGIVGHFLA